MRRLTYFCLAGWVILQAQAALAATMYIYDVNVDENGLNATYDRQDLTAGTTSVAQPLTVLNTGSYASASGISYQLPYALTIASSVSNGWLEVDDFGGSPVSDAVWYHNDLTTSGTGVLTFYSNDTDGDKADVSPAFWASNVVGNLQGFSTQENASGTAFFSTYGDPGGVPGDPSPHPTVEAFYYMTSGVVPEPGSVALLSTFAVGLSGLIWRRRRRRA